MESIFSTQNRHTFLRRKYLRPPSRGPPDRPPGRPVGAAGAVSAWDALGVVSSAMDYLVEVSVSSFSFQIRFSGAARAPREHSRNSKLKLKLQLGRCGGRFRAR